MNNAGILVSSVHKKDITKYFYIRKELNGDLELWQDGTIKALLSPRHVLIRTCEECSYLRYQVGDYLPDSSICEWVQVTRNNITLNLITSKDWIPASNQSIADRIYSDTYYRSIFLFNEKCYIKKLRKCSVLHAYTLAKNEFLQLTTGSLIFETKSPIIPEKWYYATINGTISECTVVKIYNECPSARNYVLSIGRNITSGSN